MPTPYGSRGGMAFSADELSVLRGALAVAGHFQPATRAYTELADAVDETVRESGRLRSFLLADLARYRKALPGAATGYLEALQDALGAGYLPRPDDLSALRKLCEDAVSQTETSRRTALLERCERLAGGAVRSRLLVLPAARTADGEGRRSPESTGDREEEEPAEEPAEKPGTPKPAAPEEPARRPVPTPAEVFPPRRPTPPPPEEALSA